MHYFSNKNKLLQILIYLLRKQDFFLSLYKKTMNNFAGKGLRKYPFVKELKHFLIEQAKSDFTIVNNNKMYLGPRDCLKLSVNGVYEPLETKWVKNNVNGGDIVLDVGANIGYYSLMLSRLVGKTGHVFSFEPEPSNFELLKKNILINNFTNIQAENVALSDHDGSTKLFISEMRTGMHRIYPSRFCTEKFVETKMISLDNYFKDNEFLEKISFIKMDVEGSELGVLKGMKKIFEKSENLKILMEFVPSCMREFGSEPSELLSILKNEGFKFSYTQDDNKTVNPIIDVEKLLPMFDGKKEDIHPKGTNLICER